MVKTVSAGLDAHLDEEVTSLATIWRITRTDGQEFFFTDHDSDIVFGGNTYEADTGYKRTAIQNDSSLSVDNLDVEGVFDSAAITEEDLRAGAFDYAQVRISIVNWNDLTQGEIKMRNGRLGETQLTAQGVFRAELRGMAQLFSRRIGELYQPECRADVGDSRCKVPIQPDVRQNLTAYSHGDFVRVATNGTGDLSPAIRLLVPADSDADDNSRYGATATLGGEAAVQGVVVKFGAGALELTPTASVDPSAAFASYPDSANYSLGSLDFTVEGWVRFKSLSATTQIFASHYLNTGNQRGWYFARNGSTIRAVAYSDGSSTLIDMSAAFTWAIDTWYHVAWTRSGNTWRLFVNGALLATATQSGSVHDSTEVLRLGKYRSAGFDDLPLNGFLDDWKIYIGAALYTASFTAPTAAHVLAPATAQQSAYEDRIYECTSAGTTAASAPTMDETPGNTTSDGTVTWTARQAWTRQAWVETVTDRTTFTLYSTGYNESRDVDDWFNGGALAFEDGDNELRVVEIRNWTQSSRQVELFLPASYAVVPGVAVRLYPGCDKRISTCSSKFTISGSADFSSGNVSNFRGEPYVPGQDVITSYPDAR